MTSRLASNLTVGIAGLGYVGIATGLAFAAHGHSVTGYDLKPEIRASMAHGETPYHEPGLRKLMRQQVRSGRFSIAESPDALVRSAEGIFLCLPTPSLANGGIDLRPLKRGTSELGRALREVKGYRLVIVKSTVVPGTTESVVEPMLRRLTVRTDRELGVAANPEFLAEGTMVKDALFPKRVVVGTRDRRSLAWLRKAYRSFPGERFFLSPSGAELAKYCSNAFLALKISFANEFSRLAEKLGLGIDEVMAAVGADPRIGRRFLRAGPGFGGSCLEKDVRALVEVGRELGVLLRSAEAALTINDEQAAHALTLVRSAVGPLKGKTVAVLGVAFKAGTDDVRESRAFPLVSGLLRSGAHVRVHDPVALANFRQEWARRPSLGTGNLEFSSSVDEALNKADVAVLQADWQGYCRWRPEWTAGMSEPVLIDLRRCVNPRGVDVAGLRIIALGVGSPVAESHPGTAPFVAGAGWRRP